MGVVYAQVVWGMQNELASAAARKWEAEATHRPRRVFSPDPWFSRQLDSPWPHHTPRSHSESRREIQQLRAITPSFCEERRFLGTHCSQRFTH